MYCCIVANGQWPMAEEPMGVAFPIAEECSDLGTGSGMRRGPDREQNHCTRSSLPVVVVVVAIVVEGEQPQSDRFDLTYFTVFT